MPVEDVKKCRLPRAIRARKDRKARMESYVDLFELAPVMDENFREHLFPFEMSPKG